jgi:hypothetical protein
MKTIGGLRKTRYRGIARTQLYGTMVAAAYNLLNAPPRDSTGSAACGRVRTGVSLRSSRGAPRPRRRRSPTRDRAKRRARAMRPRLAPKPPRREARVSVCSRSSPGFQGRKRSRPSTTSSTGPQAPRAIGALRARENAPPSGAQTSASGPIKSTRARAWSPRRSASGPMVPSSKSCTMHAVRHATSPARGTTSAARAPRT